MNRATIRAATFGLSALGAVLAAWVAACASEQVDPCAALTCPAGFEADRAACTCRPPADRCNGVSCGPDRACVPATGACEPRCQGVVCDGGATLDLATCVCGASSCGACGAGQGCNPATSACESSPAGGTVRTDLVNKEMSIGLHNNGSGPPQGIREAHLDFNWQTSQLNAIVAVAVPPGSITIDGQATNEAEWRGVPVANLAGMARSSTMLPLARRTNGTAVNMQTEDYGVTEISVRAAYDGSNIYFRLEWADSTQNDERGRWVHNGSSWVRDTAATQPLPPGNRDATRAVTAEEDRVQLLFNINVPSFFGDNGGLGSGCAALCHLEGKGGNRVARAVTTDAGAVYYAGSGIMHTNGPGQKVDVWNWKATRTNAIRTFDDQVIDDGSRHGDGNQPDDFSYTGSGCSGLTTADGVRHPSTNSTSATMHFTNQYFDDSVDAGCPSRGPSRAPTPYTSGVKYMYEDNSPFIGNRGAASRLIDGPVPGAVAGNTLPGYIWRAQAAGPACLRCQNEAEGRWANGRWTVELRRSLVAPDADDVDFTRRQ